MLQASERLGVPFDACATSASRYVNNKERVSNRIGEAWQTVPEYMLVPVESELHFTAYSPDSFTSDVYDFLPPARLQVPISLNLLLTTRCGTNCKYCYAKRPLPTHAAFDVEAIESLIEQARSIGVVKVDVNGGEVLLYPYWYEVAKSLKAHGYTPLISTKLPIKREIAEKIVDLELPKIQISLDTVKPAATYRLLGVQGESYLKAMATTLLLLCEAGIRIQINSLITKENATTADMDALVDFLSSFSCVEQVAFSPAGYSLYSGPFSSYSAPRHAIGALSRYVNEEVSKKYPYLRFTFSDGEFSPCTSAVKGRFSERAFCTANTRNAVILPDGRVTICEELYDHPAFIIGDLKEQSLYEVWNSSRALSLFHIGRKAVPYDSPCRACDDFEPCHKGRGVCWKTIIMAYGPKNYLFPDPMCPRAPKPINTYWHE